LEHLKRDKHAIKLLLFSKHGIGATAT